MKTRAVAVGIIVFLLVILTASSVAAGCGGWGTVTNMSPYPAGQLRYWVAVHVDPAPGLPSGYWSAFPTNRPFRVGQRVWVWGCPDATRYVEGPLVLGW